MAIAILLLLKQRVQQPLLKTMAIRNWVDDHIQQTFRQVGDNNWPID
jgi:hypothetical protein